MNNSPTLSLVVPVYCSAEILPELVGRIEVALASFPQKELILVNDGSSDHSDDAIARLEREKPWIRGINLARNFGQHNALLAGIRAARNDVVVTLDDDLQNPPEEIPNLISALGQGCDVVYGVPHMQQHGMLRDAASWLTKLALQKAMGAEVARNISAFRAFYCSVRESFAHYRGPAVNIDVLLTWGTSRFGVVPVQHDARQLGKSHYTFSKLTSHAFNMITGFSTLPLQVASYVGFAFTLFGMGVLIYVVGRYLIQGGSVPGFSFLASIIALFSGAQLLSLGIIGEYLSRMYFRSLEKPPYVVQRSKENL